MGDIRFALRMLLKSPATTTVAVLSLALGIGVNTSIFAVVNEVLLRPLPIEEPETLLSVYTGSPQRPYSVSSYPDYLDAREGTKSFSAMTAYGNIILSWDRGDQTERLEGEIATGNYFSLLGLKPSLGRFFLPEEDETPGTDPVAVVSHKLWQSRFGADPSVVGSSLTFNGQDFTVVGVAPPGFDGLDLIGSPQVWIPMMMQPLARPPRAGFHGGKDPDLLTKRRMRWLQVVGRLKPGATREQAQASLDTLARQLQEAYPDSNTARGFTVSPASRASPRMRGLLVPVAALLMSVVGVVLLIACANVANLLLARGTARRREMATRLAIGASRGRLLRQLLTESTVLSVLAGFAGILLAVWTTDLLVKLLPAQGVIPVDIAFAPQLDGRVVGFAFAASLLTGMLCGLAPALRSTRTDIADSLKVDSDKASVHQRRWSLRNLFVVTQVALSLLLLVSAGLFLKSLEQARAIDPGFDSDHLLVSSLNINLLSYTKNQGQEFYGQVVERVEALPGVRSATLARVVPVGGGGRRVYAIIEGQEPASEEETPIVGANVVALNYFQTMGIPLLTGRDFDRRDRENAPGVVIVNQTMADRFWPGASPIGQRFRSSSTGPLRQVVGVVADSKYFSLGEPDQPFIYFPLLQNHETGMSLHVRSDVDPRGLIGSVEKEIRALEKNLPLFNTRTMTHQMELGLFGARMGAWLLGSFAYLALMLTLIGIYGVMSYTAAQRTREIGIRLSLGAGRVDVLKMMLRDSMSLVGVGMGLGLGLALTVTQLLAGFLYGVDATDPAVLSGVVLLFTAVALLASYLAARRAMNVQPVAALRYE